MKFYVSMLLTAIFIYLAEIFVIYKKRFSFSAKFVDVRLPKPYPLVQFLNYKITFSGLLL